MTTALSRKCQACKDPCAEIVVPSEKESVRPVYVCNDCSLKFSIVFYNGPPMFHYPERERSMVLRFVHHDYLVPYFYPAPEVQIASDMCG